MTNNKRERLEDIVEKIKGKAFTAGLILYAASAITDVYFTHKGLKLGVIEEGNHVAKAYMDIFGSGLLSLLAYKSIAIPFLAFCMYLDKKLFKEKESLIPAIPLYIGFLGQTLASIKGLEALIN